VVCLRLEENLVLVEDNLEIYALSFEVKFIIVSSEEKVDVDIAFISR